MNKLFERISTLKDDPNHPIYNQLRVIIHEEKGFPIENIGPATIFAELSLLIADYITINGCPKNYIERSIGQFCYDLDKIKKEANFDIINNIFKSLLEIFDESKYPREHREIKEKLDTSRTEQEKPKVSKK